MWVKRLRLGRNVSRGGLALLLLATAMAHAELWGYVDDKGVARFATQQLDNRYILFFRGRTSLDAPVEDPAERDALERFKRSPMYRRIVNHPNVVRFQSLIEQNAKLQSVDPALVKAVVAVESSFEPGAASTRHALGLMQVLPARGLLCELPAALAAGAQPLAVEALDLLATKAAQGGPVSELIVQERRGEA